MLYNGVELDLYRSRRTVADGGADDLLLWSPRGPQGPRRADRGDGRPGARGPPVDRQQRAGHCSAACGDIGRSAHRVARSVVRRREDLPATWRARLLCPVAAWRVVRRRADRSDGGRHGDRRQCARRLPERRHPRRGRPARGARRQRGVGARAEACPLRPGVRRPPRRRPARHEPDDFSMAALARRYAEIYRSVVPSDATATTSSRRGCCRPVVGAATV